MTNDNGGEIMSHGGTSESEDPDGWKSAWISTIGIRTGTDTVYQRARDYARREALRDSAMRAARLPRL